MGPGGGLWASLQSKLEQAGFDVRLPDMSEFDPTVACKVICLPFGLATAREEMERQPRDNVVMVRVDDETKRQLDAWIESGAARSRSEAAALFIREGLRSARRGAAGPRGSTSGRGGGQTAATRTGPAGPTQR